MKDPNATTLVCQDAATNVTFTGTDDAWGNGDATNRETGCVDAFYGAEQGAADAVRLARAATAWTARGGWVPIRVGLNDVNAYYDGTQVQVGHTQTGGKWIGSIDVVAHEIGHGIDDHTPGGISGSGTQEFVADTFGAMTEWYADNPRRHRPTTQVGEKVNLVGNGPIRYMYNPSLRRRRQLLLLRDARPPRCTPPPGPATTGSTCSPRAPTRPTASRPARPATAPRSPASASRRPPRSCTTRC